MPQRGGQGAGCLASYSFAATSKRREEGWYFAHSATGFRKAYKGCRRGLGLASGLSFLSAKHICKGV